MEFYRRRLPHWQPEGAPIFLTWRLHGNMPKRPKLLTSMTEGQRFAAWDRELDRAITGPTWLADARVAQAVVDTFLIGQNQWKLYELTAWVVMSNHVHILVKPETEIEAITRAVKKYSATIANRILGKSGTAFWQDESYDHWVRDSAELSRIVHYIEWNPVRACLVTLPEQWLRTSARNGQVGNLPHVITA